MTKYLSYRCVIPEMLGSLRLKNHRLGVDAISWQWAVVQVWTRECTCNSAPLFFETQGWEHYWDTPRTDRIPTKTPNQLWLPPSEIAGFNIWPYSGKLMVYKPLAGRYVRGWLGWLAIDQLTSVARTNACFSLKNPVDIFIVFRIRRPGNELPVALPMSPTPIMPCSACAVDVCRRMAWGLEVFRARLKSLKVPKWSWEEVLSYIYSQIRPRPKTRPKKPPILLANRIQEMGPWG